MSSTGVQTQDRMTRRHLSPRQVQTVDALMDAALAELQDAGYADLSVRSVARRAGVAAATAYTYFASKEHLVAEVFWRRLADQPDATTAPDPVGRAAEVLCTFGLVVADEAELAAACTVAVLAPDPDVADLRERIGVELHRRLVAALGPDVDAAALRTLGFVISGVLLQVGTGHLSYDELPGVFDEVARTILCADDGSPVIGDASPATITTTRPRPAR